MRTRFCRNCVARSSRAGSPYSTNLYGGWVVTSIVYAFESKLERMYYEPIGSHKMRLGRQGVRTDANDPIYQSTTLSLFVSCTLWSLNIYCQGAGRWSAGSIIAGNRCRSGI